MTMDFTPSPHAAFSAAFEAHIDAAMEAKQQAETPRNYLGASRLGEECSRLLAYEYHRTPKDEGKHFKGRTLRIFDMGHDAEERMASYLRLAGFNLLTERPDGKQFGFYIAKDPKTGEARIAGHTDGIITAGPEKIGDTVLRYPFIWENKALNDKGSNDVIKRGVKMSKPVYYSQVASYQAYLQCAENPALFTTINRNTGQLVPELVPFDAAAAQAASDRGARVVSSLAADELPRIGKESTDFRCKFCSYARRCWNLDAPEAAPAGDAKPWNWGQ